MQVAALANSTGIGGGLFWVPLFNAMLNFPIKNAAALSQACVACGTVGASFMSICQRHPMDASRPMIDYGLTLVLMPALMLGISVGVLLNIILPAIVIVCILFTILVIVAARTLQQAVWIRRAEKRAPSAAAKANANAEDMNEVYEQEAAWSSGKVSPQGSEGAGEGSRGAQHGLVAVSVVERGDKGNGLAEMDCRPVSEAGREASMEASAEPPSKRRRTWKQVTFKVRATHPQGDGLVASSDRTMEW